MKKLISTIVLLCFICTSAIPAVLTFAEDGSVIGKNLDFYADFDNETPAASATDGNVTVVTSDDGNAASVVWNSVAYGGANYPTESFNLSNNTLVKFDVKSNNATNNVIIGLFDKDGDDMPFRIQKSYVTAGKWYTYVVTQNPAVSNSFLAYRCVKGTNSWESATVDFKRSYSSNAALGTTKNAFRLAWGSSSSGTGSWLFDNIKVYSSLPVISAFVPERVSEPIVNSPLYETFEESTNVFDKANYNKNLYSLVKDADNPNNTVLEYNLKGSKTIDKYGGTIRTSTFTYPESSVPYTVSFDFRKVSDCNPGDYMWIQTRTTGQYTCLRIDLSQFEKNVLYTVSYYAMGNGTANSPSSCTGTKTVKATGESSKLIFTANTGWTGQTDNFCLTTYNGGGSSYSVDSETGTTKWANVAFQLDNVTLSYDKAKSVKTELVSDELTSGNVIPMLCAYDENGVMTAISYDEKAIVACGNKGFSESEFDIMKSMSDFENAKSVKALYWQSFNSAKALGSFVEIGDKISDKNVASSYETKTINIDNSMIPDGVTSDYTVFAYTVPFMASKDNIPDFDATKHTILGVWQAGEKITSVKYKASLYDEEKQDIVLVCNGKGAQNCETTLIEVNNAPQFTNVSMLLGSDASERNFTWFSLSADDGKITYEKVETMIDGEFSSDAKVVNATREHDSSVYSKKEYYYQNKAVMTGLEPQTEYCYQLSNGKSKHKKVYFTTDDNDSSFSFAFGGDPQVGGSDNVDYAQETLDWGRTLNQITTAPEFDGIEFFVSAGDQIESASTGELVEAQYDIYLNHDEFLTLPQAVVLGNHDNKPAGYHVHHFNQPNMDVNYGATYRSEQLNSADYYFVYNSALFIVLNTNTFDDLSNGDAASRANDKADADKHGEFIAKVLEETKDNKDILWKIVLYHQSPYGGSYHGNYTFDSSTGVFSRTEQYDYINMREYLMPYLYEAGVDLVLSGHDHCYTRTHIIKPAKDENGKYTQYSEIPPYKNTSENGKNYYTYSDGTTAPTFVSWTDKNGKVYDGVQNEYLKVKYQPSKVTDPDGILHVTGASSSGSQVNGVEHPNHYASVALKSNTRHMSRIDITANSLKLTTYNLGSNTTNDIQEVDSFEIERTAEVPVMGVELEKTLTLPVGQSKELKAKLSPSEPSNNNVSWFSDNTDVAEVDQNGKIIAKKSGKSNITVTTEDGAFTAMCEVTVIDAVKVSSITLPEGLEMKVGDMKTVIATVYPENATTKTLSWSVDKPELATVNSNGTVYAKSHGILTVTATATDGSGISASTKVTINYTPSVIALDCEQLDMNITDEKTLSANISPANASYKDITWSSSDNAIATVDENGKVYALAAGKATITASTKDSSASCSVTVKASKTFSQNYEDSNNKVLWDASPVWSRVQDEDGDYVLKFDGSKITSKIGTRYTAQIKAGANTVKIPTSAIGYAMEFEITRLSSGGHSSLNINTYSSDSSCKSFKLNMSKFEIGCAYDVKVVFKGSSRIGYYKKAEDKFWIKDDGSVWTNGQNVTTNSFFNHISMYPYDNITDLATAQQTLFIMDDISISTIDENDISVINKGTGKNAVLDIKTGTGDAGGKIFVAAYKEDEMLYVVSEPCDVNGNATVSFEITGEEDLFKVFVLKDEITPLKPNIICR